LTAGGVLRTVLSYSDPLKSGPLEGFVEAAPGILYGVSEDGVDGGRLLRLTPSGSLTTLRTFAYPNLPKEIIVVSPREIYGTMAEGGANGKGAVFHFTNSVPFASSWSSSVMAAIPVRNDLPVTVSGAVSATDQDDPASALSFRVTDPA